MALSPLLVYHLLAAFLIVLVFGACFLTHPAHLRSVNSEEILDSHLKPLRLAENACFMV